VLEEPKLLSRRVLEKLVPALKLAIMKRQQEKGYGINFLWEALGKAEIGLEPPNLDLTRKLLRVVLGYDPCEGIDDQQWYAKPKQEKSGSQGTPSLQDLTQRINEKAKAEPAWRFWGLYVHVAKMDTLREAYKLAKANNGAPGIDGVTFEAIEQRGVDVFLEEIRNELVSRTYLPMRNRKKEIPKGNGKVRTLGIPTIRDRVVQGALKLILEPIFEADFQPGSFGYRPGKQAHEAVERVGKAIALRKLWVIDLDLKAFFDNVKHHIVLEKVAERVKDRDILHLLKLILKATGKKGVPQGGVISPLLSNIYLNEVDKMLEKAKEVTRNGPYYQLEYARYADDLVVLVNAHPRQAWILQRAQERLREELAKVQVELNGEKSRVVDLSKGESFGFLGFDFRWVRGSQGKGRPIYTPKLKKRGALLGKLREVFQRYRSQQVRKVVQNINPILRGWVNYFRVGNASRCFQYVRRWVELKIRRHMMRAKKRTGFGWKRWSTEWIHRTLGLFNDYRVLRWAERQKALTSQEAT